MDKYVKDLTVDELRQIIREELTMQSTDSTVDMVSKGSTIIQYVQPSKEYKVDEPYC